MPAIREELYLADKFSQTFRNFDAAANASIDTAREFQSALEDFAQGYVDGLTEGFAQARSELERIAEETQEATDEQERLASAAGETGNKVKDAEDKQKGFTEEVERSERAAGSLMGTITKIASAIGAVKLAKEFIETADEMSQITAKLNLINDGFQTTEQLQQMIFDSAQRTRSSYQDTAQLIARIGMNTGDTFSTNSEMVAFAENLNKSFKIAGASAQEQSSVILQLSQALAGGLLRGQEFNAVMSGAPNIIKNIANYMGVTVGEMRDLAAEGQITSDIIRNAMLSATTEINAQFETLPRTFGDIMTTAKNQITTSLNGAFDEWIKRMSDSDVQGAIDKITDACVRLAEIGGNALLAIVDALGWVAENWEALEPLIDTAIATILMYKAVNIASAAAVGAAWMVAHAKIVASLGLLYVGYKIAEKLAETMFDDTPDIQKGGDALNFTYKYNNGTFDAGEVKSAYQWEKDGGLANAEKDLSKAEKELEDVLKRMSDKNFEVQTYAELMGGGNTTQNADWYAEMYGGGRSAVEKAARDQDMLARMWNEELYVNGRENQLRAEASEAIKKQLEEGVKVKGEVKLSEEDIKIFRDVAEGRYMTNVNLETLAPNVSVNVEGGAGLTAAEIAEKVAEVIIEQSAERTAIAH